MTQQGARDRHEQDDLPNASGLPDTRTDDHGPGHADAGAAAAGRVPGPLQAVCDAQLHLPRTHLPQPQRAADPLPGHRRHQDRLHARVRLQPGDVGPPRWQACRRRRLRRQDGKGPQRPDARAPRQGAGQSVDQSDANACSFRARPATCRRQAFRASRSRTRNRVSRSAVVARRAEPAADRAPSITVAKVRRVLLGPGLRAEPPADTARSEAQPVFAAASAGGAELPRFAPAPTS